MEPLNKIRLDVALAKADVIVEKADETTFNAPRAYSMMVQKGAGAPFKFTPAGKFQSWDEAIKHVKDRYGYHVVARADEVIA